MVEQYSDPDRMDKLETQVEKAMTKFETQLEKALARMEAKMDTWQQNFVSKELMEEKLRARDQESKRLSNELQRLEKEKADKDDIERLEEEKSSYKHTLPLWAAVILSAVDILILLWMRK